MALAAVGIMSATGPAAPVARFLAPAAQPLLLTGVAGLVLDPAAGCVPQRLFCQ